jgi:putative ABC transport system permease protein
MFKNYFKIAFRNLFNSKSFSVLNIVGLSIGMTCCLLIFQYVSFESSFDRFHSNKNELYRVLQAYARGTDEITTGHAYTAQALAPALKEGVPEIADITRLHSEDAIVSNPARPDRIFESDKILYADRSFLKMFSFPIVSGDAAKSLQPGTAVITQSAARKYFGETNPQGQVLEVVGIVEKSFSVAAVVQDPPSNSHLQFEIILAIDDLLASSDYANEPEGGWSWNNFTTYIHVHPDADINSVQKKMTAVLLKYRGEALRQWGGSAAIQTQPLTDIHLNADITGAGSIVTGNYRTIYFFLVIGLITLVIALVNYINLATARALNRSREVGVRKVVGARREQLVVQFLYESAITNIMAVLIALALAAALIPVVNQVAETQLDISQWTAPGFLLSLGFTVLAGTLLAGLYPAFVLSSFKPASVLKGKSAYVPGHLWLRRGLVVVQFTACIVLLAGTTVVYNQLNYMRQMDLGLDLEQVVDVTAPRVFSENANESSALASFMQELRKIPGIEAAALSSTIPGLGFNWNGAAIRKATDDPAQSLQGVATYIDSAFAPLYGLELIAGKAFGQVTTSQAEGAPWSVMLNETTTKNLGYDSPADAVDQMINIGGHDAQVLGVYKDFKWSSAHHEQQSIVFRRATTGRHISVRLGTNDLAGTIKKIQQTYESLFPGNVFNYNFVDQVFDVQYKNDQRFAKLFSIFAGMTVFIACLGLFGLVAFTAQQRTKEIGMRKVLGATVVSIVGLLSKDFLKLVLAGFVLAIPLTLYVMNQWLENFAYRTEIGVGIFVVAGLIAIVIALATVSWQSLKAAIANPVKSLRNE